MSPRRVLPAIAATIAAVTALAGCGGSEASGGDGSTKLIVTTFLTEDHPATQAFQSWMDEVEDATGGSVTFETYYNGSLCGAADALSCAESGTADISFSAVAVHPEKTLANIGSVAFVTGDLEANQIAINRLYEERDEFREEYEESNQKILYVHNNTAPVLVTKEPLASLSDVKGMKIRAGGAMASAMEALGANPVTTDLGEIYEGIERGVVDGAAFPIESFLDYRLEEVADNVYDIGEYVGSYAINTYSINLDQWNNLDESVQEAMDAASQSMVDNYVADWLVPSLEDDCDRLREAGIEVQAIGPEDAGQAWRDKAGASQREAWIEAAQAKVDDAEAYFQSYLDFIDEASSGSEPTVLETCGG